jgi:hypothetical protein
MEEKEEKNKNAGKAWVAGVNMGLAISAPLTR